MAIGTIQTSILTDIANAIRQKAGVATLYKPSEMAAAIAALDGTDAGGYVEQAYMELESGVLSDTVLSAIADAIRAQNGSEAQYVPSEMATAILALSWGPARQLRALLLSDGTLEFNYRSEEESDLGTISQSWEIDPAGYSSASSRPWHSSRSNVLKAVFDADFADAHMTNLAYLFHGMYRMKEIVGFEACSGATDVTLMFNECRSMETIWATEFDNSSIETATNCFYSCNKLVGQVGYVPDGLTLEEGFTFGETGALTNPSEDARIWCYGTVYNAGKSLVISESKEEVTSGAYASYTSTGRSCVNAHYRLGSGLSWYYNFSTILETTILSLPEGTISLDHWFHGASCMTTFNTPNGLPSGIQTTYMAFGSCVALERLDLSAIDPSSLTNGSYFFSNCSALQTIIVADDWALPDGAKAQNCFYGCDVLVGGNGTTYDYDRRGADYLCIDREGQPGLLTAASDAS